jgi:hypothetical protein
VTIAICAEWSLGDLRVTGLRRDAIRESRIATQARAWFSVGAAAWALAIWVSAYEPIVLFVVVTATIFLMNRQTLFARNCRAGWILFCAIIMAALLIERRIPSFAIFQSKAVFRNWARTIGELGHVSPANPIWLHWCGYILLVAPVLLWLAMSRKKQGAPGGRALPMFILVLLAATYVLTIWQARWGYFFVLIFALAMPSLLEPIKSRTAVWIAFFLSIFPMLRDWDEKLWPNEAQLADRVAQRNESTQLRELALSLRSSENHPFLAPWWLSPEIAYWSEQTGVAGSSHESLPGIEDSALVFVSQDWETVRKLLENHKVAWVIAYDSERTAQNSAEILGVAVSQQPVCFVLDKTPSKAPPFLVLSAQNGIAKLYRVVAR